MHLYEITNGYIGESYCRVYVWAEHEAAALTLARKSFQHEASDRYDTSYWQDLRIRRLFSATAPAFATRPSDSGWKT